MRKHVEHSPCPPRVSELVCKPENGSRAISQSYHETDFNERMFRYYSSIYQRERKSILPIAAALLSKIGYSEKSSSEKRVFTNVSKNEIKFGQSAIN